MLFRSSHRDECDLFAQKSGRLLAEDILARVEELVPVPWIILGRVAGQGLEEARLRLLKPGGRTLFAGRQREDCKQDGERSQASAR